MNRVTPNSFRTGPDANGHFGIHGGRYVAETLMPLILDVERAYSAAKQDPSFQAELDSFLEHYVGRPSPLYFAERLTAHFGGPKLYFNKSLKQNSSNKVKKAANPKKKVDAEMEIFLQLLSKTKAKKT